MTEIPKQGFAILSANRVWFGIGALGVGSLVGGALVAPPLQRLLVAAGRRLSAVDMLRDLAFESVAARCVLAAAILLLFPLLRWIGVRGLADIGLPRGSGGGRNAGYGFLVGVGSILPVLALGRGVGAFRMAPPPSATEALAEATLFLVAALLVGAIEEVLFRGVLFGLPRRSEGVLGAGVFSSAVFSLVHFARPEPVVGVAHAHWYSGLALLPDTLRFVHGATAYLPFMITLFLMGMCLCLVYEMTGSLYAPIGLHAGWIFALRGMDLVVAPEPGSGTALFGGGGDLATSYAALVLMALIAAGSLAAWRRSIRA